MKVITSRENQLYKQTAKLLRKKSRDETGQFLLEGRKPLRDALEMGLMIEKIFTCLGKEPEDWIPRDKCIGLDRPLFASLSDTVHSQGIIAVVRKPKIDPAVFTAPQKGPVIVLDRLQDPGNAGTIIRTAEAAGFYGILALKESVDLYAPKVVRSAAGALLRMPVLTDLAEEELLSLVRSSGRKLLVTALEDAVDCFETELPGQAALVIGNEGSGVSRTLLEEADLRVKIPMAGQIESLNAAVAAGILMYRITRGTTQ
jgi:TrmH family RNA methyltransferase